MSWTIPGFPKDTYSKAEVAALLAISTDSLDGMVAEGRFPAGLKPTAQTAPVWTGAALAAWFYVAPMLRPTGARGEVKEK